LAAVQTFGENLQTYAMQNIGDLQSAIEERQALEEQIGQDIIAYIGANIYLDGVAIGTLGAEKQLAQTFNPAGTNFNEMFGLDKITLASEDAPLGTTEYEFTFDQDAITQWAQGRLMAAAEVAQEYQTALLNFNLAITDDLQSFRKDFMTALEAENEFYGETGQDVADYLFENVSINGTNLGDIYTAQTG